MINRVLIRIKVVQMLYSHLILEKNFTLESQPAPPTKEKRFAYKLYMDMLVLMLRIANSVEQPSGAYLLRNNRFIKAISADDKIKSLLSQYSIEQFPLESAVKSLSSAVKSSSLFKQYIKEANSSRIEDIKLWQNIFNLFLMKDVSLVSSFEKYDNYSIRGVERMRELISDTFTNFATSQDHIADALKNLKDSLERAYDLYILLLMLPIQITEMQAEKLESGRTKFLPKEEDINPNMRFVENELVHLISSDEVYLHEAEKRKLNWLQNSELLLQNLLQKIIDSEYYKNYMELSKTDLHQDCELWRNLYKHVILCDSDFVEALEEMSLYWNDDIDIIGTFVLKTFKRFDEYNNNSTDNLNRTEPLLPMYKDDEDARFASDLFCAAASGKEEYREYIDKFICDEHWDKDRMAFMDIVVVITAIAELLNFPKIPIRVTVNEYIEMAKSYSTPKSGAFINGILASIIGYLKTERKLLKEN